MSMKAWVFVRGNGALYLEHVGWAFQWDKGRVMCGGTENPPGTPHTPAFEKGAWHTCINAQDVLREFTRPHMGCPSYDAVKIIDVPNANPVQAWSIMSWCEQQDYGVYGMPRGRNCRDDAFDVLAAMGVSDLPWPASHPAPNEWFRHVPGTLMSLKGMGTQREALEVDHLKVPPAHLQEPPWRISGSPAHDALMQRLEEGRLEMTGCFCSAGKMTNALRMKSPDRVGAFHFAWDDFPLTSQAHSAPGCLFKKPACLFD